MLGGGGKTPALVTTQKWVNPLLRHDKANAIEFEWLVGVFQQVEQESSRDEKLSIFFQRSHLTDRVHPQSIYPILRLLLPAADSQRTQLTRPAWPRSVATTLDSCVDARES